ncbi:hypothetical protein ABBQ38_005981 [Trebouxia sp. C0009 RCD-2024]
MPARQQPDGGMADQAARRLRLQQAAEQLLPSSSSDSEAEAPGDQQGLSETLIPPGRAAQAVHLDSSSDEASHRKHKRRRESAKHKKHKKHRIGNSSSDALRRHEKKKQKVEAVIPIVELERRAAAQGTTTRGSAFSSWANLDIAPEDMYFVDSRGDRNNLVYGGLYRADVAAYHRTDPCGVAKGATHHGGRHFQRFIDPETDAASQATTGSFRAPRYYGARQARAERDRGLKRLQLGHAQGEPHSKLQKGPAKLALPLPGFIPLAESESQGQTGDDEEEEPGESQDQYVMRRTKEFNIAVRERPHDLQLWLDYAAFQDGTSSGSRGRRGIQAGIAEKKVSILERALEFHPGSDRLLMALLDAAQAMSTPEELKRRWQVVLSYHGGSPQLWREYLHWQRAQYATFAVRHISQSYQNAVQALKQERVRRVLEGAPPSVVAETEEAVVAFFIEGCRFEMQSGHMERAIASIQAALEYACFAPSFPVGGETTKAVAFRAFWEAGAPLVGDEGAQGWAAWEASQGVTLQTPTNTGAVPSHGGMANDEDANARQEKEEKGGWGQWVPLMPETPRELKSAPVAEGDEAVAVADEAADKAEEGQEEGELVEVVPEPTDEELLAQLGLQLEQQMADLTANDELPAGIMQQWAEEELQRDARQWQPRRQLADQDSDEDLEQDGSGGAAEAVSFQDIKSSMLGPLSEGPQLQLVCHCLELLGAPLGMWQSSNATASRDASNSQAGLSGSLAQLLLQPGWLMQAALSKHMNIVLVPAMAVMIDS